MSSRFRSGPGSTPSGESLRAAQGRRGAALSLARWVGVVGVGLCLTAVEIVPAHELLPWLKHCPQPDGSLAVPRNYQLQLASGLQLLWPLAMGGPADYFGEDNYWESVVSFGLIPLVLIGIGSSQRRSTRRREGG